MMDNATVFQVVGAVLVALFGVLGGWFTAHQARNVARATNDRQERRDAVDGYDKLTGRLSEQIQGLSEDLATVRTRIESVEGNLSDVNRTLSAAIAYISRLLNFIAAHAPDQQVPPAPSEISEYLNPDHEET